MGLHSHEMTVAHTCRLTRPPPAPRRWPGKNDQVGPNGALEAGSDAASCARIVPEVVIEAERERCRICFLIDLPAPVVEFLKRPNPAVIACIRPDGYPMSVATWYDWEDGLILVNMSESRSRLGWLRANPKASLTALGGGGCTGSWLRQARCPEGRRPPQTDDWYRHVSLYGSVVRFADDSTLADIDRLCLRHTGKPFSNRDAKRVSAWIEPHGWHGWDDGGEVASTDIRT